MPTSNEAMFSAISYMAGEIQALTAITQAVICLFPDLDKLLGLYDSIEQNGLARIEALPVGDEAVGAYQHMMSAMRSLVQQTLAVRRG